MSFLYHTFFFDPLYNILISVFKLGSWVDAGLAVILITILVRLVLYPLSRKAVVTQVKMNEISPELEAIKEKYKDKPEEQAHQTLALYREKGVNPFSGILVILIQIPIILALYQIFIHLPEVDQAFLYAFVDAPEKISTLFLGVIDISKKSLVLALLAGASTYLQLQVANQSQKAPKGNSFGDNLTRSMQTQMKYIFPVIMFFIALNVSGVIGLYFVTTNIFSIAQEIVVRKNIQAKTA